MCVCVGVCEREKSMLKIHTYIHMIIQNKLKKNYKREHSKVVKQCIHVALFFI